MDNNQKLLGKLLGEVYRLQNKVGVKNNADASTIYGLLNGFESTISDVTDQIEGVSIEEENELVDILDVYNDPDKLPKFNGYYDIENNHDYPRKKREKAYKILKKLKAEGYFLDLIEKMDSTGSPSECKKFDLFDWEK